LSDKCHHSPRPLHETLFHRRFGKEELQRGSDQATIPRKGIRKRSFQRGKTHTLKEVLTLESKHTKYSDKSLSLWLSDCVPLPAQQVTFLQNEWITDGRTLRTRSSLGIKIVIEHGTTKQLKELDLHSL